MAMAFDTPIPGYGTKTVNNMRLWAAKATRDFELRYFNEGDYIKAVADKNESENLSKVLYPNDTTEMGRELRLKQQYFFVCASLQRCSFRHSKHHEIWSLARQSGDSVERYASVHCHRRDDACAGGLAPSGMGEAWDITTRTFAYTNHTLMPEALETWPVAMFGKLLPRHLQIIYEINLRFLKDVMHQYPGDTDRLRRMSIIDETGGRRIRMAHLAIVGSHKVNGVAQIHTELMKQTIFSDFDLFSPARSSI